MYVVMGDSATRLTVGNGGRGESGVVIHVLPVVTVGLLGRGLMWVRGGGRILWSLVDVVVVLGGGDEEGDGDVTWWAGEPVSF